MGLQDSYGLGSSDKISQSEFPSIPIGVNVLSVNCKGKFNHIKVPGIQGCAGNDGLSLESSFYCTFCLYPFDIYLVSVIPVKPQGLRNIMLYVK